MAAALFITLLPPSKNKPVRFGSIAAATVPTVGVRFTPKSGHHLIEHPSVFTVSNAYRS